MAYRFESGGGHGPSLLPRRPNLRRSVVWVTTADENIAMGRHEMSKPRGKAKRLTRIVWGRLAPGLILLLGAVTSASAQMSLTPDNPYLGNGRSRRAAAEHNNQPPPQIADLPPVKEPWPRLDTGAVLCRSRDDLSRFQAQVMGGAGAAPDCHAIRQRTPIQIIERDGPSHTHVVAAADAKQTGWTNAYLPSTPPSSTTGTAAKH
jgi:hypothetical protein